MQLRFFPLVCLDGSFSISTILSPPASYVVSWSFPGHKEHNMVLCWICFLFFNSPDHFICPAALCSSTERISDWASGSNSKEFLLRRPAPGALLNAPAQFPAKYLEGDHTFGSESRATKTIHNDLDRGFAVGEILERSPLLWIVSLSQIPTWQNNTRKFSLYIFCKN